VLPDEQSGALVLVAGGIGITPFRSMLRYIQDEHLLYRVTLIYSNRDRASTPFLEELDDIANANPNIRVIATMTNDADWTGETRLIDADLFKKYLEGDLNRSTYMVAGPPGMAEAVTEELRTSGVRRDRISTDSFSGY
jgi:ferredoxin-NADP reductase